MSEERKLKSRICHKNKHLEGEGAKEKKELKRGSNKCNSIKSKRR